MLVFLRDLLKKCKNKFVYYIDDTIRERNIFFLKHGSEISTTASIKNSYLKGEIRIGDYCNLFKVNLNGDISIGKNTTLYGPNCDVFSMIFGVSIGNFCSIARNVSIQEHNHDYERITSYYIFQNVIGETVNKDIVSKGGIEIENDVWIGAHSVVLSGSKIGNGAVIAANSVVNSEIPPYAIAGGVPAKILKYRFEPEVIKRLEEIQWWNWTHDKIKQNKELFEGQVTLEKLNKIIN